MWQLFVWIWGIWAGYTKKMLLHSKSIVYSAGMSFPVFFIYNMYYIVSSSILKNNYNVKVALVNYVLLSFVMLVIVYITMMLSVIYKKPIFAAIISLLIVVFAPYTIFGVVTNDYTVIFRRNKNKEALKLATYIRSLI